ncbi:MAG: glycoside hydrolase family 5 protein [Bacteroidales bacterium]|nr:glycoside hydrolase family 5 protein [Bacteroidales bacterium]
MKQINLFLLTAFLSFCLFSCSSPKDNPKPENEGTELDTVSVPEEPEELEHPFDTINPNGMRTAKEVVSSIYAGWNLGNTLEATGGETSWGEAKTTQEIISYVKSVGFNAVRIPCAWDIYQSNGVIKESWMKRVHEVVDYAINENMYVMLNIHWDKGWIEDDIPNGFNEEVNKKYINYWTQIANEFIDYDDHLIFAGLNEPDVNTNEIKACLETIVAYEQSFIYAVRSTGGNNRFRTLVVQGPESDMDKTYLYYKNFPKDLISDRLALEVHCYNPFNFTALDEDQSWGKMCYYWGDFLDTVQTEKNAAKSNGVSYIKSEFSKLKKKFVDKDYPIIMGEYGCKYRDDDEEVGNLELHRKSVCQWVETVTRESKNYGLAPFYWDCERFRIVKRTDLSIRNQEIYEALMKGASEGVYPY